jgi:putative membrane protein
MYWGDHFWGMHAFWWMFWVAVVIALVMWTMSSRASASTDSALDELRRRYAAGEINDDEYQHRREVLDAARRPTPPSRAGRQRKTGGSAAA